MSSYFAYHLLVTTWSAFAQSLDREHQNYVKYVQS